MSRVAGGAFAAFCFLAELTCLAWSAQAQLASYSSLSQRAPVVGSMLVSIPNTNAFLMVERPQKTKTNTVGVFDLGTGNTVSPTSTSFVPPLDSFCGAPVVLANGNILLAGGDLASQALPNGLRGLVLFDRTNRTMRALPQMTHQRWYPTVFRTVNNKISILSGTKSNDYYFSCFLACSNFFCNPSNCIPAANEEVDEGNVAAGAVTAAYPPEYLSVVGPGWYPFATTLPLGDILVIGRDGGAIYTSTWALLQRLPAFPASVTWKVMYPYTAPFLMLPYRHSDGYVPRVAIFGGSTPPSSPSTVRNTVQATNKALRLELPLCEAGSPDKYCPTWSVEDMLGYRRVMGDAVALPNGRVLVTGGAMAGSAGISNNASFPQLTALQYDLTAAAGARFRAAATTRIPRLYHSTACLELGGSVVVSGCDTCWGYAGTFWSNVSASFLAPYDTRVELLTPNLISNAANRPGIVSAPATIACDGSTFEVTLASSNFVIAFGSLVSPCATTHATPMGSIVVTLEVVSQSGATLTLRAPPADKPGLVLPGWFKLFVVASSSAYSRGVWLQVSAQQQAKA